MKVIVNRFLPFKGYAAMNFCGILFVRPGVRLSERLLNHERIHTAQQRELLFLPFFVLYVLEWLWQLLRCGFDTRRAYRAISFEREAYAHEGDERYLSRRGFLGQWRAATHTEEPH